jgi:hypothetical protein
MGFTITPIAQTVPQRALMALAILIATKRFIMNKKIIGSVVLGSMLTFAGVVYASNWADIGSDYEGKCHISEQIDTATWTRNGKVVRAWARTVYGPNHVSCSNKDYKELRDLSDYDCQARMIKTISVWFQDWSGKITSAEFDDVPIILEHVIPDTIGGDKFDYVCAALKHQDEKEVK